jgi:lipid-A-disaccharide synthase
MGFWEVFVHLPTIMKNLAFCKKDIIHYQPDTVILVDYPGFNLRIAEFAHQQQFRVIYYISPQIWAWKKGRIKKIKQAVDKLLVILPFEYAFYQKYNYEVFYVGHPVLDEINNYNIEKKEITNFRKKYHLDERPIIALLPGSRKQEIKNILPKMVKMKDKFPNEQFVISKVKYLPKDLYLSINKDIPLVEDDLYSILLNAKAAVVTSGTASLETALWRVPQVVCYKGSPISYLIARWLVKGIKYISLANLILDKQIFKELIQNNLNTKQLASELDLLLHDDSVRKQMLADYDKLRNILGNGGASVKAAEEVLK